jgi:N-acetylneuraminic acid mutarotase
MTMATSGTRSNWLSGIPVIVLCLGLVLPTWGQTWTKISPGIGNLPAARMGASAVYDPDQKQMIVFGGVDGTVYMNDLWAFDFASNRWSQLNTVGTVVPEPRAFQTAVYDPTNRRVLMWSGQTAGGFLTDVSVWALNLSSTTWIYWEKLPSTTNVPARYGSVGVLVPFGNRLIIFGGFGNTGQLDDTYQLDNSYVWQLLLPRTYVPHARSFHTATYDPFYKRVIIFGGQSSKYLDGLWAFSPDSTKWDSVATTTSLQPEGRYLGSTVTTQDNQIILFGGRTASGDTNDVWQFSIARKKWTQYTVTEEQPAPREGHAAIYRPDEDDMVIFGGKGAISYNDLWSFSRPVTSVERESPPLPEDFVLYQNSPNPFNPTTRITFQIPQESYVTLKVFNLLGIEIATLIEGELPAGIHSRVWDAEDTPSGVYVYRLTAGGYTTVKKMVLMK